MVQSSPEDEAEVSVSLAGSTHAAVGASCGYHSLQLSWQCWLLRALEITAQAWKRACQPELGEHSSSSTARWGMASGYPGKLVVAGKPPLQEEVQPHQSPDPEEPGSFSWSSR